MISLSEIKFLQHVDEKYSRTCKYHYNEDDFQFQFLISTTLSLALLHRNMETKRRRQITIDKDRLHIRRHFYLDRYKCTEMF